MDIRKVKKLIELLEESGIDEIEITEGEEAIRISRTSHSLPPQQMHYAAAPAQWQRLPPHQPRQLPNPAPRLNRQATQYGHPWSALSIARRLRPAPTL